MSTKDMFDWKGLAKELAEHLDYCGWGDSWERECSEDLRERTEKELT